MKDRRESVNFLSLPQDRPKLNRFAYYPLIINKMTAAEVIKEFIRHLFTFLSMPEEESIRFQMVQNN